LNRWIKISLIGLAIAAPLMALGTARYMVYSLTKPARLSIRESPDDYDLKFEDVEFHSTNDDLLLRGWYITTNASDRCIIMVHGGKSHRADPQIGMLDIAKQLVNNNFNVLMFDLRGHGESDDGRMTGGQNERGDVEGAVQYVKSRGILPQNIGLLGFSLGGAASLLAAAEDEQLPAIVADSCWANLADLIKSQISRRTALPTFLGVLVPGIAKRAYGLNICEVRPIDAVKKIAPRAVFFVHGEVDTVVSVENAIRLYHSIHNPNNRLWVVPEAEHVQSFKTQPEQYTRKIIHFFNQYLETQVTMDSVNYDLCRERVRKDTQSF